MKHLLVIALLLAACQTSNKVTWIVGKHSTSAYDLEYVAQDCNETNTSCTPVKRIKHVSAGYYVDLCTAELGQHECDASTVEVTKQDYDYYVQGMPYPRETK